MALDTYVDAHADDTEIRVCRLVRIEFPGGTVYWTDFQLLVYALSQTWSPMPIRISGIGSTQGDAGGASIELGDAALVGAGYVTGGTAIVGVPVRIYDAWIDPTTTNTIAAGTKLTYEGRLGRPATVRSNDSVVSTFELAPYADFRAKKFPKRWMGAKCPFIYKDDWCQATSILTTCPKTYAACVERTNQSRFGGVTWIPPDGYVIEWGDGTTTLRAAPESK